VKQFQVSPALPTLQPAVKPSTLSELMEPVMAQVGARREATQARSQAKMRRVLATTNAMLVAHGPAAVTTTAVAAGAGVSVGWLYNFFDDRDALLEEILIDGLRILDHQFEEAGFSLSAPDWRDTAASGIDAVIQFVTTEEGFRALWFSADFSGRMIQANRLHDDALAAYLCGTITETRDDAPDVPLGIMTQYFVGLIDKGFDLAFRSDPSGDPSALAEMKRASLEYLERFLP
jgi:AcrR family transcriptional regulator